MLTGESAPVLKSSLPLDPPESGRGYYDPALERDSKFRLLSGTKVVQVKRPGAPLANNSSGKSGSLRSISDFGLPADASGKKRVSGIRSSSRLGVFLSWTWEPRRSPRSSAEASAL